MAGDKYAKNIPLVTVCDSYTARLGTHPTSKPGSTADKCEQACGWSKSKYFFAGIACPGFGTMAFAYTPELDAHSSGSVSPFDSGGLWDGHMAPHNRSQSSQVRVDFLKKTLIELAIWREEFGNCLSSCYNDPYFYLEKQRPDTPSNWGDVNSPACEIENTDFRCWTFEVRICDSSISLSDHLWKWSCTRDEYERLMNSYINNRDDAPSEEFVALPEPILGSTPENAVDLLQEKINSHLKSMP